MATDAKKFSSKLSNARIVIVGGTSGIGFAVTEILIEHAGPESQFMISSSSQGKVDSALARLREAYPSRADNIHGFACNLDDDENMEKNIANLLDWATKNGEQKLDHVINTAGNHLPITPLGDWTLASARRAGNVRFFASLLIATYLSKKQLLNPGPQSSLTFTSGSVGQQPIMDRALDSAFQAGLQGLTRGLALDMAPIRVNMISPHALETERWSGLPPAKRQMFLNHASKGMLTNSVGKPEDVAECYLACLRNHNMTGSIVSSNGGHFLMAPGYHQELAMKEKMRQPAENKDKA